MASKSNHFRSMSIVPTVQDLLNKRSNYWDSRGAYDSTENYLNSQFLSIREGFTKRLSEAVDKHLNLKHSNQQSSTRIYKNVKIEGFEVNDDCFGIKLFFEDNESRQYLKPSLLGKLVILTRDNFKTIHLATVIHCHPTYLRKGYVFVEPFSRADLKSDAYGLRYTLLETTKHFESYYETLSALKGMKDSNFPMTQYIIQCCVCTALPRYLQSAALLKFQNNYILPEGLDKLQQITKDQQLDESQLDALKHAVTREFAVIEGPPGTGKTLLASKIVHILLDNEKSWSKHGPIVIICATDPALDQILESILPHTTSVIRVGSQTDNEVLKPYSLMAKREQMSKRESNCCASLYKKKYEIEEILRCIQKLTLYAKFFTASNDAVFQTCMMDLSLNKYKSSQEFSKWLTEKCFNSLFEDFNCNSTEENGNPCVQLLKNFEKDKCMLTDNDLPIDYIKRDEKDFGLHINPITLKDLEGLNQNCSIFQQKLFNNTILSDPRLPTDHATKKDYWESMKACHDTLIKSLFELEKKYHQEKYQLENLKRLANLEIFKEQKVIGITAGCIAMMKYSLNSLQAPIVLVDEAEKVRETHIVCSMTKECQHLILIGDKTMPRLLPTLFERMVNVKENCVTLKYQHRMRPEITKVMSLYTDKVFQNHASALNYPRLRGVESNLFFLSHNHPQTKDGINRHEIEFLIALAQYFLRLGYKESDITILSTCCRQANAFLAEMLSEETLKEVQVSTVFDYLGKENKIVLLSLVNNNDCKVEYLKGTKALSGALSRAREGLFIMANLQSFNKNCEILSKAKQILNEKQAFGYSLKLRCQNHPNQSFSAKTASEVKKCTDGCSKVCGELLSCGHVCTKLCHTTNRDHKNIPCTQKCNESLPCNHACPMTCMHYCQPCKIKVERTLKCGHKVEMPCSDNLDSFPCPTEVDTYFSECNHTVKKPCYMPIESYECTHDCDIRLACGHSCSGKCHAKSDPNHIEYKCMKDCARVYRGCVFGHPCQKLCHEDCGFCTIIVNKPRICGHIYPNVQCSENVDKIICDAICNRTLKCGHKCLLKCGQNCSFYQCNLKVKKMSLCGHFEKEVACNEEVTFANCDKRCQRRLLCGHYCIERCRDPCTSQCEFMVRLTRPGLCGHVFSVPCYLQDIGSSSRETLNFCEHPCNTVLCCGHDCPGNCGSCKNGSVHKLCEMPCSTTLPCGHKCELPCDKQCHPCLKPCQLKCRHSKCNNRCGEPCFPCLEPCDVGCEHRRCQKKCSELCEIEPCSKPCKKTLPCNHLCVGYCGEPCPSICRVCNYDQLKKQYPDQVDDLNVRFVVLPDCGHCIESKNLMRHIEESAADIKIQLKRCPQCQHPILNCTRLMNSIKRDLKDLNIIKRIMFYNDDEQNVRVNQKKYFSSITTIKSNPDFKDFYDLQDYLLILENERKKNLSFYEVDVLRILSEILCHISNTLKAALMKNDYYKNIKNKVSELVKLLPAKLHITAQRLLDIQCELRRLRLLVEAGKHSFYNTSNGSNGNERSTILDILYSYGKFSDEADNKIIELLRAPKYLLDKTVIAKDATFKMIQWFKCPIGHYYSETEMNEDGTCTVCTEREEMPKN